MARPQGSNFTEKIGTVRELLRLWVRTKGWRRLQEGMLTGLMLVALVRLVVAFDLDALIIATLSGLLLWVLSEEARRNDIIGRKLDHLLDLQRYGPLTPEDREVIAILDQGGRARRAAGKDLGAASGQP